MKLFEILFEGKKEILIAKYPEKAKAIEFLSSEIPGSLLVWAVNVWKNEDEEESSKLNVFAALIKEFLSLKAKNKLPSDKKDITKFRSVDDLEYFLDEQREFSSYESTEKEEEAKHIKIYEDGNFLVVQPLSRQASCKYGQDTKWCVAATSENMFNAYINDGYQFIYIINKRLPKRSKMSKIAIAYVGKEIEVYDSTDDSISLFEAIGNLPDNIVELIRNHTGLTRIKKLDTNTADFANLLASETHEELFAKAKEYAEKNGILRIDALAEYIAKTRLENIDLLLYGPWPESLTSLRNKKVEGLTPLELIIATSKVPDKSIGHENYFLERLIEKVENEFTEDDIKKHFQIFFKSRVGRNIMKDLIKEKLHKETGFNLVWSLNDSVRKAVAKAVNQSPETIKSIYDDLTDFEGFGIRGWYTNVSWGAFHKLIELVQSGRLPEKLETAEDFRQALGF
jgi:hypothetical protein